LLLAFYLYISIKIRIYHCIIQNPSVSIGALYYFTYSPSHLLVTISSRLSLHQLEAGHNFALWFGVKWQFQHTCPADKNFCFCPLATRLCAVGELGAGSACWQKLTRKRLFWPDVI